MSRYKKGRAYIYYGISRKRFLEILDESKRMNFSELVVLANKIDPFVGEYMARSMVYGESFEILEARNGYLPTSKTEFYRKRRILFHKIDIQMKQAEGRS